ncbi:hypothetical protein CCACVL1_26305 [Corchorus capsularis]|uniref:Uncharacterized protein n=1 Tax=Corchorus capsularis TaxID=210143 RepID=A0A1R3GFE8_COCAP|nr:hypothetical protein CCACVL1_26305 [Corchorus capsularis]
MALCLSNLKAIDITASEQRQVICQWNSTDMHETGNKLPNPVKAI